MSGFDFGKISGIVSKFMDTDYIDIKRDVNGELQEIYQNIKCNVSYKTADNPNPETIDIKPIIQSIEINMPIWVDIQNNDYIIVKKMSSSGKILFVYNGRCGNPVGYQSRQKINMIMNSTSIEEPAPVPPENPINIYISYKVNETIIQPSIIEYVSSGKSITIYAPVINGYVAKDVRINGVLQGKVVAIIEKAEEKYYEIDFLYESTNEPSYLRLLINGVYTKNDGSLSNGYYLYKKINLTLLEHIGKTYKIQIQAKNIIQIDTGEIIPIEIGSKLVLYPTNEYVIISEKQLNGSFIILNVVPFSPNEEELNAYVTMWYD